MPIETQRTEIDPGTIRRVTSGLPYSGTDYEIIPEPELDRQLFDLGVAHNQIFTEVSSGSAGSQIHSDSMKTLVEILAHGPRTNLRLLRETNAKAK